MEWMGADKRGSRNCLISPQHLVRPQPVPG